MRVLFVILVLACKLNGLIAFDLQCDFKTIGFELIGSVNSCDVKNLIITEPNQIITSVNGQSRSHFLNQNVQMFYIYSQTVHYFPKGIELFFPSLVGIYIGASQLKTLDKCDLKPFPQLKYLSLHSNNLEQLDGDLFTFNPVLRLISFIRNPLKKFGATLLNSLTHLEKSYFDSTIGCIESGGSGAGKTTFKASCLTTQNRNLNCNNQDIATSTAPPQGFKAEKKTLLQQNKELAAQLEASRLKQQSSDGNLEAALENLWACSHGLNSTNDIESGDLICKAGNDVNCEVLNLKVKYPDFEVAIVKDESGKSMAVANIRSLISVGQQTLFLPRNLGQLFPQLTSLSATDSGLYGIDSAAFQGMNYASTIVLNNNKIMIVPSNTFKDSKNLEKLDLSFNLIREIDDSALSQLSKLKELKVNDNFLKVINNKVFDSLVNLENLQLNNNKLIFIFPDLLAHLSKLSFADFSGNLCIDNSFPNNTKLQIAEEIAEKCVPPVELRCFFSDDQVYLDEMTTVGGYTCKVVDLTVVNQKIKIDKISGDHSVNHDIMNVTVLVAIEQDIKYLPLNLAEIVPRLEKLIIERSKLNSILKQNLAGFNDVKFISFRHNNLSSMEKGAFDDTENLEYLNLANNQIATLESKIFAKLNKLRILILTDNKLVQLHANIIPRKNSIEELRVNSNKLSSIAPKIFRSLGKAKLIDFTANDCIDLAFGKADQKSKTFSELYVEVGIHCEEDDDEED